jgi:hypothetical protein
VESVPPPHERSWRHPSELAPPPLESPTRSFRIAAAVSGAASVALVGLFALAITPGDGPISVSSSTTNPFAFAGSPASVTTTAAGISSATTLPGERSVALVDSEQAVTLGIRKPGETHTTVWISERITASALLMADVGGVSVVDFDDDGKSRDLGIPEYRVATSVPRQKDQVIVMIDGTPRLVELDEIDDLNVDPGTAVFDREGKLIALCDHNGKPVVIVTPPPPSTTTPPPPTSRPTTTTTDPPTSTTHPPRNTTTTEPPRSTTTEPPHSTTTTTEPPRSTTTEPPTTTTEPPTTTTQPPDTTTTEPTTTTTEPPEETTTTTATESETTTTTGGGRGPNGETE